MLKSFHLNGHTIGITQYPRTQNLELRDAEIDRTTGKNNWVGFV